MLALAGLSIVDDGCLWIKSTNIFVVGHLILVITS